MGNCFPTEGDFAILELVEVKRRYPLVRINAVPYLVEAVHRYFKEAEERGCAVDEGLKRYVADRIRSLLEKHGVDLGTMLTHDLHGVNKDVLDVLKMLGPEPAPPPRPVVSYVPASHKPRTAARPPPSPPLPPPARPISPPPMPPRGYKPTRRRRRIKSALAKAAVVAIVLLIALAAAPQLADYFANRIAEDLLLTSRQTAPQQVFTVPQATQQPSYTSGQLLTYTTVSTTTPSYTTPRQTTSPTPTPTTTYTFPKPTLSRTTTTYTPPPPTFANTLDDPAVRAAFEALNRYRRENGVPLVEFIQLKTPFFRAKYLYNHGHLSHYDVKGRHPIYYYTLLDSGAYAVEENLGWWCVGDECDNNVSKVAERLIYDMVYADALSDWGHRDSLLDPCHNKVSIAVAWSYDFYIAVYMVGVWAEWIEPPHYHNGVFSFKGYVYLPPSASFYQIFIYRDVPNPDYYRRHSYSIGELYAGVLPPDYRGQYRDIITIWADRYVLRREGDRWYVDVAFRFKPSDDALYTVVMFANSTGIKWSPMAPGGEARLRWCKIFRYTVVHSANSFLATSPVNLRGYLVLRGVSFRDGSTRDVKYNFTVTNGVLTVDGDVPLDVAYPVEVYVTEFSIGSATLAPRGGAYLAYSGTARDLANGLDFSNLFTRLEVSAVDSTGAARSDWTVQLIYQGAVLAERKGALTAVVPRTSVLGQPYVVKVVTTALTPEGSVVAREQLVAAVGDVREVRVMVPTAMMTVFVVDGFGQPRDWPVEIENVARGVGSVSAELSVGSVYTAKATGLGFTNVTKFVARGPEMSVDVKIPTARLTARVVDGFGNVRSDWLVEVVGVASGQGSVSAEVLAGKYTVRAVAFGREFVEEVEVGPGQDAVVSVQVPTARLSVYVVDEYMRPIDQYVTLVEVSGPVAQLFSEPPRDLEVLAGLYFITVTALGKRVSTGMTLHSGDNVTVRVLVPGAAGIDVGGTRITYSTLYTVLGVAVAVAVVGFVVAKLRPRGKGH